MTGDLKDFKPPVPQVDDIAFTDLVGNRKGPDMMIFLGDPLGQSLAKRFRGSLHPHHFALIAFTVGDRKIG